LALKLIYSRGSEPVLEILITAFAKHLPMMYFYLSNRIQNTQLIKVYYVCTVG